MDLAAYTLLALEGLFALWLLLHEGLLKSRRAMLVTLPLLIAAFVLRGYFLSYETLDYRDFLSKWVQFYRENLGFRSLAYPLGNYNIPYLYFLCFFSYLPMRDLYLIKLLSILFDVVLAYASMRLLGLCVKDGRVKLACFLTVLLLPTVVLNGAVWGQCDSIYVALALLGLWLGLSDRPVLSVLCFTLSFGFKLQAVFILPIMAVLWFRGNYRLWHFALFPAFYVLLVLPAVALGKPFIETLTLYTSQTGSIGTGLNYNSPSVYAFFWRSPETADAANLGIAGAFTYMLVLLSFCFLRPGRHHGGAAVCGGHSLPAAAHARALFLRRRRAVGDPGFLVRAGHPGGAAYPVCVPAWLPRVFENALSAVYGSRRKGADRRDPAGLCTTSARHCRQDPKKWKC